jgi:Uma2 family endonuclease
MSVQIARRHFNVTEYYRMMEAGILSESDHVELIDGEVIEVSPIGSRYAACVDRLNRLFNKLEDVIVRVQSPVRLDDFSEPQPDITLLRLRPDFYAQGHPAPSDVLLVVEIADSSTEFDRVVKLPLYAEAGIPEFWLVNLPEEKVEAFSHASNNTYQESQGFGRGEFVTSRILPALSLSVDSILG